MPYTLPLNRLPPPPPRRPRPPTVCDSCARRLHLWFPSCLTCWRPSVATATMTAVVGTGTGRGPTSRPDGRRPDGDVPPGRLFHACHSVSSRVGQLHRMTCHWREKSIRRRYACWVTDDGLRSRRPTRMEDGSCDHPHPHRSPTPTPVTVIRVEAFSQHDSITAPVVTPALCSRINCDICERLYTILDDQRGYVIQQISFQFSLRHQSPYYDNYNDKVIIKWQ